MSSQSRFCESVHVDAAVAMSIATLALKALPNSATALLLGSTMNRREIFVTNVLPTTALSRLDVIQASARAVFEDTDPVGLLYVTTGHFLLKQDSLRRKSLADLRSMRPHFRFPILLTFNPRSLSISEPEFRAFQVNFPRRDEGQRQSYSWLEIPCAISNNSILRAALSSLLARGDCRPRLALPPVLSVYDYVDQEIHRLLANPTDPSKAQTVQALASEFLQLEERKIEELEKAVEILEREKSLPCLDVRELGSKAGKKGGKSGRN